MRLVIRRRATFGAAAALGLAMATPARAQPRFPRQPVRLIVPFSPGTGSDTVARLVANAMKDTLGQPFIVENRGGAGGITGTEQGARLPADGHALTLGTTSTLIVNPALNPMAQYRFDRDFTPVAGLARTYFAIVTANTAEAPKTLQELVQRLKAQDGTYGSSGVGTITHLASELFVHRAGVEAIHVPYRGSGQALTDVVGGQVLFASDTLAAALPLIHSGGLRALAVTSAERVPSLPDVPTAMESGFPDLLVDAWFGLVAPSGTPPEAIGTLSDKILAALRTPDMQGRFRTLELEPLAMPPEAFADFVHTNTAFWVDFIKQADIKVEF